MQTIQNQAVFAEHCVGNKFNINLTFVLRMFGQKNVNFAVVKLLENINSN